MANPRDPEGLMPDSDASGGPSGDELAGRPADDSPRPDLPDRTDTDRFGSDPDARYPGDAEDPVMTTGDEGLGGLASPGGGAPD